MKKLILPHPQDETINTTPVPTQVDNYWHCPTLIKEVREHSKGKALIAKIEQEAYLSRSRMSAKVEEEQKKAFRRAELAVCSDFPNLFVPDFVPHVSGFINVPLFTLWDGFGVQ